MSVKEQSQNIKDKKIKKMKRYFLYGICSKNIKHIKIHTYVQSTCLSTR